MATYKTVTGYCPVQQMEYDVEAVITPVPKLGTSNVGQKVSLVRCDYHDECGCPRGLMCPITQNLTR